MSREREADGPATDPRALLGRWSFTRSIEDRLAGNVKTVDGTVMLTAEPAGTGDTEDTEAAETVEEMGAASERIRWWEEGMLHLPSGETVAGKVPAQDLPVFRTLFVVPRGEGWFVVFEDGHDFHPWTTGRPVVHPCGDDLYAGRIEYEGRIDVAGESGAPASWTVRWDVTGPQKDYTMITRLHRAMRAY